MKSKEIKHKYDYGDNVWALVGKEIVYLQIFNFVAVFYYVKCWGVLEHRYHIEYGFEGTLKKIEEHRLYKTKKEAEGKED